MPFFSQEPKSRLRSHIDHLLFFLLLATCLLLLVFVLNYRSLLFPEPHRSQISPKKYIQSKTLPQGIIKPEVIEHGSRDKKQVALTFDADMTVGMKALLDRGIVKSWYNAPIKETLDREQVKATVFLGGLWSK